ncbi:hypothetical protein TNCV_4520341 [Trichonephila clavipes]|nr:hypothetical protein TNCV_4520341 [Trichonephila clavipes]
MTKRLQLPVPSSSVNNRTEGQVGPYFKSQLKSTRRVYDAPIGAKMVVGRKCSKFEGYWCGQLDVSMRGLPYPPTNDDGSADHF